MKIKIKRTIISAMLAASIMIPGTAALADTYYTSTGGVVRSSIDDVTGYLYGWYDNPTYTHRVNVHGSISESSSWKRPGTTAYKYTLLALHGNKVTGSDR